MMRQTMRTIDAQLPQMVQHDSIVTLPGDSLPRHLTAWLQNDVIRKLMAVDTNATGVNNGETDIWFMGGDVAIVQQVADIYAIDGGRIVLWTDETFEPRGDITPELMMDRETKLMATAASWAGVFGIKLP
ncbi:MAG TPA: hypothetical protein VGL65_05320 [Gemmatimonadales bacterium]